ncbi:Arginyl-tRNA--protein transferase 1 [Haplosporangium sp. Z 767]|nr:Arginyl-tRNA--protein transferase 1 [Haplosporangium sp. Z 767]KAF9187198.1 Arginyl-tRNA--protein transferase 1 [Haplosporangium sp. Z 11]
MPSTIYESTPKLGCTAIHIEIKATPHCTSPLHKPTLTLPLCNRLNQTTMLLSDFSVITPYGTNISSCGYCKSSRGSHTYGMLAHLMTCKDYQKLVNRGWRRSGKYLYKPNLRDSCCPQYTIRMKANEFEASKHQRQAVNRFNHFIQEGDENFDRDIAARQQESADANKETRSDPEPASTSISETASTSTPAAKSGAAADSGIKKQKPRKPPKNVASDLRTRIRSSEYLLSPEITSWKHRLRIKLEPASFTDEKHALFVKYQMNIHHEPRSKCKVSNFTNFLVDSPLTPTKESEWTEDDPGYGSFHQCYYLDEKLIAVSVLDILPECVSAVYFFYDPDYSVLSLGKYSAQREIALTQTLSVKPGYEDVKYYYMGFYIFTCQKMAYKGQFYPSYLLDPETYNWIEFKKCQEILKEQRYSCFENPVPVNPLFEEKIRAIINNKKGDPPMTTNDDEDEDWDSVDDDDDDEEYSLDSDELEDKDLETLNDEGGDNGKSGDGKGRKKTKLNHEDRLDNKTAAVAAAKEKERRREIERVYNQTTAMTPPGCMNPNEVTMMDLTGVLCLTSQNVLRPIIVTNVYKNFKDVQKLVAEYYAYVGEDLANTMILHIQ